MGPLFPQGFLNEEFNLIWAFLIGIGFGFLLEAAGFTNTRKLAGVFYGYDVTVIKVFFTAAITGLIGVFILHNMEIMDVTLTFYPKTFWLPTLIGGAVMGLGFVIGGFCPGTSLCAASTGKIDAMSFIGGVFLGIFGFIFTYDILWKGLREAGGMGKVNFTEWLGIKEGVWIFLFVIMAIATFVIYQKWQNAWQNKLSEEDKNELGLN